MKAYTQKDLGYPRTPTSAVMHVTMEDASVWAVPVQAIVDSRDENYAEDKEDTIQSIRDSKLSKGEIDDWAANNMNWDDVKEFATRVQTPRANIDWEDCWVNGHKEIVGAI